ncbi:hypothetical protein TRFO_14199 [Tritrichomonas foetus]|uniref:Uncharacterized protein n=1 Tax=Tritrichomonas foetus TaxID=1144522 RepID=A0A1J4KWP6_9EUKA|nr:hypothetical protein TRFO_14199 [Tritrichomonas foetus]|eukprot:OHT15296.1 hypothetical protein TRFO_14199 [Tritrichomonas foetus]
MFFFALFLQETLQHDIYYNSLTTSYATDDAFKTALAAINIAGTTSTVTASISNYITLKASDFPRQAYHEWNGTLENFVTITGASTLGVTIDLSTQSLDRFQLVSFSSLNVKFTGDTYNLTSIQFDESSSLFDFSSFTLTAISISMSYKHVSAFKALNFVRFKLTSSSYSKPSSYPTMTQRLQFPEGNGFSMDVFQACTVNYASETVTINHDGLSCTLNIPSFNYSTSFYFNLKETGKTFSVGGDYNYDEDFPVIFELRSTSNTLTFNEGNYLTSTSRLYFNSGSPTYTVNYHNTHQIREMSIGYNVTFAPTVTVNARTFSWNSNRQCANSLNVECRNLNFGDYDLQCQGDNSVIVTVNSYISFSGSDIRIYGTLRLGNYISIGYYDPKLTVTRLEFFDSPTIYYSVSTSYALSSKLKVTDTVSGTAYISIDGLSYSSNFDGKAQDKDFFYPVVECSDCSGNFELEYNEESYYYFGFTRSTSILRVAQNSGNTILGLIQDRKIQPSSIYYCFPEDKCTGVPSDYTKLSNIDNWKNTYTDFTRNLYFYIYGDASLSLEHLNHSTNYVSIQTNDPATLTLTGTEEPVSRISQLAINLGGKLKFTSDFKVTHIFNLIINGKTIEGANYLHFSDNTYLTLDSLNHLNTFKDTIGNCGYVSISSEEIKKFNFLADGWEVTLTDDASYKVQNIYPAHLYYSPRAEYISDTIEITKATNEIKSLVFYLENSRSYKFPDWSSCTIYPFILNGPAYLHLASQALPLDFNRYNVPQYYDDDTHSPGNCVLYLKHVSNTATFTSVTVKTSVDWSQSIAFYDSDDAGYKGFTTIVFNEPVYIEDGFTFGGSLTPEFKSTLAVRSATLDFSPTPSLITIKDDGRVTVGTNLRNVDFRIESRMGSRFSFEFGSIDKVGAYPIGNSITYAFVDDKKYKLLDAYNNERGRNDPEFTVDYLKDNYEGYSLTLYQSYQSHETLNDLFKFEDDKLNIRSKDVKFEFGSGANWAIYNRFSGNYDSFSSGNYYRSSAIGVNEYLLTIDKIKKTGLSIGAIIGIVVACVVVVVVVIIIIVCCCCKGKKAVGG